MSMIRQKKTGHDLAIIAHCDLLLNVYKQVWIQKLEHTGWETLVKGIWLRAWRPLYSSASHNSASRFIKINLWTPGPGDVAIEHTVENFHNWHSYSSYRLLYVRGTELNATYRLLVYADTANLLWKDKCATNKSRKHIRCLWRDEEVALQVNTEKSCYQNGAEENRPKWEIVIGGWRKLHSKELHTSTRLHTGLLLARSNQGGWDWR